MLFACMLLSIFVRAQLVPVDVRSLGMGNSDVAAVDSVGIHLNPAMNVLNSHAVLNVASYNKYFIPELATYSVSFLKPINETNCSTFSLERMGNSTYHELNFSAGLSKKLSSKMTAGVRLHYQQWNYGDEKYSNESAVIPSAGLLIKFYKNLIFGCRIENFKGVFGKSTTKNRIIASSIQSGVCLVLSSQVSVSSSIEQVTDKTLTGKFGCEYKTNEKLIFRSGIQTDPFRQSFGICASLLHYRLDIAFMTHPSLGNSGAIGINFIL